MAGAAGVRNAVPAWREAMRKFLFNTSGYNKLGMLRDDCLRDTPVMLEALRRLPTKTKEERQFRITRALYLSMRKEILPQEEWTKYEEDVRYLQPYIQEVKTEMAENKAWKNK